MIVGKYKLLVAQNYGWAHGQDNGWKEPANDSDPWLPGGERWIAPDKADPCSATSGPGRLGVPPGVPGQLPCLFDLDADEGEHVDIGVDQANAALLHAMWKILNETSLTAFCRNVSGGSGGSSGCNSSPAKLLGPCNPACADLYWAKLHAPSGSGPVCGVPGCGPPA